MGAPEGRGDPPALFSAQDQSRTPRHLDSGGLGGGPEALAAPVSEVGSGPGISRCARNTYALGSSPAHPLLSGPRPSPVAPGDLPLASTQLRVGDDSCGCSGDPRFSTNSG